MILLAALSTLASVRGAVTEQRMLEVLLHLGLGLMLQQKCKPFKPCAETLLVWSIMLHRLQLLGDHHCKVSNPGTSIKPALSPGRCLLNHS